LRNLHIVYDSFLDGIVRKEYDIGYISGRRLRLPVSVRQGEALTMRNAIQRFMYGRYGNDQLNLFLMVVYLLLYFVSLFVRFELLYWVGTALLFAALFRLLSRNIERRQYENAKFMRAAGPFLSWLHLRRTIHKDKEHIYFKCPSCGQQLRVPRGKGKITVTCRSCGASFQEKS